MNSTFGTVSVLLLSISIICQIVETDSARGLCTKTCRDTPPFKNGKGRCARSGHLRRCKAIGSVCRCIAENAFAPSENDLNAIRRFLVHKK